MLKLEFIQPQIDKDTDVPLYVFYTGLGKCKNYLKRTLYMKKL
jgi:hypothetical protein